MRLHNAFIMKERFICVLNSYETKLERFFSIKNNDKQRRKDFEFGNKRVLRTKENLSQYV